MKVILVTLIKIYKRFISPLLGDKCIYYPSCSTYAMQAIEKYGAIKGTWLALKRLIRCNPFSKGGIDPVP